MALVFSTSCKYCVQEYPYWKELAEKVNTDRWKVLAVTSENNYENIKRHLEEYRLNGIRTGSVSPEDLRDARLLFTPMTLAIDKEGEVKKVWPGLWTKEFDLPE